MTFTVIFISLVFVNVVGDICHPRTQDHCNIYITKITILNSNHLDQIAELCLNNGICRKMVLCNQEGDGAYLILGHYLSDVEWLE